MTSQVEEALITCDVVQRNRFKFNRRSISLEL